ncbi:glycosyltransferase family 4 protein [Tengunoibacter tsumagoiensis]|uniref:Glycosyl transferase n=1 Tax=Tengunoibacter tsumagoiensis TaxID=2014871 RepID=A0A402A1Q2_9CHLR|nr:glycosyltransferase family 4 protein [Tengunoibacter tsumagoiensis]GCE12986.1 glycosyl transferase [Tengunoibacter tsumagoiensis]
MKIAHIAPPWIAIPPKNYGGTEVVLYNLVEEQVAQGHDVTLFAPGDAKTSARLVSFFPQALIDSGVPWEGHLKAYYHIFKSVEYIKTHRFDIVHTHLSSCADMYVFPLISQMLTPHVSTLHSRFPFDRVQTWTGDADQYYMDWCASVPMVAISESARKEVTHPLNFVATVHHGLPMKTFKPTVETPEDALVWLGRMVPEKGPHLAIQAAKAAGRSLILAGTIDRHVRESVNYFEEVIKPQLDGEQIKYIGPVNMEQKLDLLSRAYGFLNPITWEEPFGMVMIEAMAVGCPVISFARGAAPEIIMHRKSGFLVHDVEEMIRFIPRLAEIDRRAVRAYVEQNFSVRAMADKYTRAYKKVIASSLLASSMPKVTVTAHSGAVPLTVPAVSKPGLFNTIDPLSASYSSALTTKAPTEAEPLS